MRTGRLTISLLLIVSLALPTATLAQDAPAPTREWTNLKTVPPGDKVAVKLKDGKTVEGKFSSVSETTLTLAHGNKPADLNRETILSVYHVRGKSATKATLIGAGVGAAAGAALGVATTSGGRDADVLSGIAAGYGFLLGLVVGAVVGAGIGYGLGKRHQRRTLIYEAK